MTRGVYLLHFKTKYKHAQHYIGYATNIERRLEEHANGHGARLPQVVTAAGILIVCARIWPGQDRNYERQLKNRKGARHLCPICNPKSSHRNAPRYTQRDLDIDL